MESKDTWRGWRYENDMSKWLGRIRDTRKDSVQVTQLLQKTNRI